MKQRGALLLPSKMLSEWMVMLHIHRPCVSGLSFHSSVSHVPRWGTGTVSHFVGGCLRRPGLKYCLGPFTLKFIFSSLWSDASITWGLSKPIQYLRHSIVCLLLFFLHIRRFPSPSWLSTPPSLPLLHFTTILSLLVSPYPAAQPVMTYALHAFPEKLK